MILLRWFEKNRKTDLSLLVMLFLFSCAHSNPESGAVKNLWLQANVASFERRYDEALSLLQKATKKDPEFADAWLSKGMVYKRIQNDELARKCYEVALLLYQEKHGSSPENMDYVKGYAEALSLLGYKKESISVLDKAMARFPQEKDLLYFKEVMKRAHPLGFNQSTMAGP
jgi:tetratricopeptide (TPR) repeat protein